MSGTAPVHKRPGMRIAVVPSRPSGISRRSEPPPRAAVHYAAADSNVATILGKFLRDAGFTIVPYKDAGQDVAVVILSEAATKDPAWQGGVANLGVSRRVPVCVDSVNPELVPATVRPLNWVVWKADSPSTACGLVLAAALSDPDRYQAFRRLVAEAQAWARAAYARSLLIADHRRATEAADLLKELEDDALSFPDKLTSAFVGNSLPVARKHRRARLRRRAIAAGLLVLAAGFVLTYLPRIQAEGRSNHAAIVTSGEPAALSELPQWSAVSSGALLLNGSTAQKELARKTLYKALTRPWDMGGIDTGPGYSVENLMPYDQGRKVAVIVASRDNSTYLADYDTKHGRFLWAVSLGGTFWSVDLSPDETHAVVVGSSGICIVDLVSHSRAIIRGHYNSFMTRWAADGQLAIAAEDGSLLWVSLTARHDVHKIGRFADILDLRSTSDGRARALVDTGPGRYELLDALSGRVLAAARLAPPVITAGAAAPASPSAVIVGSDRQLWTFGSHSGLRPTGIAVADATSVVQILPANRVVVGGQAERVHVVYLPTGSTLGNVCGQVPRVILIEPSHDGNAVGCMGAQRNNVALAPPGPMKLPAHSSLSSSLSAGQGTTRVLANGAQVTIKVEAGTPNVRTLSFAAAGAVTALAVSPDGARAAVAAVTGDIAVISLDTPKAQTIATWHVPTGSAPKAIGWTPFLAVETSDGLAWRLPDCAGCATDAGLIRRLRARIWGCMHAAQLTNIDAATRNRLGVTLCQPFYKPAGA